MQEILTSKQFREKYIEKVPVKGLKYGNVRITNEYGKFDSKGEWKWFQKLLFRQNVLKEITDLKPHEKFVLVPKNGKVRAVTYTSDATYIELKTGLKIVTDFKSGITKTKDSFVIKRKMMLEKYEIEIKIVEKADL